MSVGKSIAAETQPLGRRAALRGLGVAGLVAGLSAAAPGASKAFGEPVPSHLTDANVHAVTVEDLRAATEANPSHLYHVTDPGRAGMFFHDPDDTTSGDDEGLILVSASGLRFKPIWEGSLHASWFGAKNDYDPQAKTGTPSDSALRQAWRTMRRLATKSNLGPTWRVGIPVLEFEAGNYLLTEKGLGFRTDDGLIRGFSLQGQGIDSTTIHFDCPEDANGSDNYLFLNEDRIRHFSITGITFQAVSGTERFIKITSRGTAGKSWHHDCRWNDFRVAFDIPGPVNANADLNYFQYCYASVPAGGVFWKSQNSQSVLTTFYECAGNVSGTFFDYRGGGNLLVIGGSWTTFDDGVILNIDDPESALTGFGNTTFNFHSVRPEIRGRGALARVNSVEAHVTFETCQLTMGTAYFARPRWAVGTKFDEGDSTAAGYASPLFGRSFVAKQAHTASADTEPLSGKDWQDYWSPVFDLRCDAGSIQIRGGVMGLTTQLTYRDGVHVQGRNRSELIVTDADLLAHLDHLTEFTALDEVTNLADLPRAVAEQCRPYVGAYPSVYWVEPGAAVDVALNATAGYYGATHARKQYVFRASPTIGEGLPGQADGEVDCVLPPGAHVLSVAVHAPGSDPDSGAAQSVTVTSHDDAVTFWPLRGTERLSRHAFWHRMDSEESRVLKVRSTLSDRTDGFIVVEYV